MREFKSLSEVFGQQDPNQDRTVIRLGMIFKSIDTGSVYILVTVMDTINCIALLPKVSTSRFVVM